METVGEYLERIGPMFGVLVYVLGIGVGVACLLIGMLGLTRWRTPA